MNVLMTASADNPGKHSKVAITQFALYLDIIALVSINKALHLSNVEFLIFFNYVICKVKGLDYFNTVLHVV
jgi:hypothetical protein